MPGVRHVALGASHMTAMVERDRLPAHEDLGVEPWVVRCSRCERTLAHCRANQTEAHVDAMLAALTHVCPGGA